MIRKSTGKRKSVGKKKSYTLPGDFLVRHIKYDTPTVDGIYACYYKPEKHNGWSSTFPSADMKILSFNNGKFFGNVHVLAWIGPLPVLSLDELADNEECVNRVFYTGTLNQAAKGKFKTGPHFQYMLAYLSPGRHHEFIFEINTHKTVPNPIARYSIKKEKWVKVAKKNKTKYVNGIAKLQKRIKK